MNLRGTYLVLCVLGFALPYAQFVPWVMTHGLDVALFVSELFANRIGGFFGMDVLVSAGVVTLFIFVEGRRLGMRKLWLSVIGIFLVGVSFGLPLFLFLRHPYTLKQ